MRGTRPTRVGSRPRWILPLHLTGALSPLGYARGDFPVAEALAGEILSLPLFPGISAAEQERVVAELGAALDREGA